MQIWKKTTLAETGWAGVLTMVLGPAQSSDWARQRSCLAAGRPTRAKGAGPALAGLGQRVHAGERAPRPVLVRKQSNGRNSTTAARRGTCAGEGEQEPVEDGGTERGEVPGFNSGKGSRGLELGTVGAR